MHFTVQAESTGLLEICPYDVRRRGPVRRIRTVLDGTIVKLMDLEEMPP